MKITAYEGHLKVECFIKIEGVVKCKHSLKYS